MNLAALLERLFVIVDGREARVHKMPPSKDRWKLRSITYQGIADAMGEVLMAESKWPKREPRVWWVRLSHEDQRIYYSSFPNDYCPGIGWVKVKEVLKDEDSGIKETKHEPFNSNV